MSKIKTSRIALNCFMVLYALICLYPLLWLLFYSLKDNDEIFTNNPFGPPLAPKWINYYHAFTQFNIIGYFQNSVFVTVFAIGIGIICALMFSYVVARVRNRPTNTLRLSVIMGMFIPIQALMTPLVVMVKNLQLINSLWSLIIPYVALSFPFAVILLYGFYSNLPTELEESAYVDGASFYRCYFSIILPLVKPAILVLIIYQFLANWNEFSLALILTTKDSLKTLPLGLASFSGQYSSDWGSIGASLVIASIPVTLLYIIFSNQVEDAMAFSGMKN